MGRRSDSAPALEMTERHYRLLKQEGQRRSTKVYHQTRIEILLRSSRGESQYQVCKEMGIAYNKVKAWRRRWTSAYRDLRVYEKGPEGQGLSDAKLLKRMLEILEDLPRSGAPKRITLEQEKQLIALACEDPVDHGLEMTDWSHEMLAKVAIAQGIVEKISGRWVGEILKKKRTTTP